MHEIPGFLLLLTGEGKLLFLSDSVSEHLGHSMVSHWRGLITAFPRIYLNRYVHFNRVHPLTFFLLAFLLQVDLVAQGDSVYDIIDPTDHFIMRSNLVPPTSPETGN